MYIVSFLSYDNGLTITRSQGRQKRIGSPCFVSYRAFKRGNNVSSEIRGGLCGVKLPWMERKGV